MPHKCSKVPNIKENECLVHKTIIFDMFDSIIRKHKLQKQRFHARPKHSNCMMTTVRLFHGVLFHHLTLVITEPKRISKPFGPQCADLWFGTHKKPVSNILAAGIGFIRISVNSEASRTLQVPDFHYVLGGAADCGNIENGATSFCRYGNCDITSWFHGCRLVRLHGCRLVFKDSGDSC